MKPKRSQPSELLWGDAFNHCHNIATLAGLLEVCGRWHPADAVEAELVASAGGIIKLELRHLRDKLARLRPTQ